MAKAQRSRTELAVSDAKKKVTDIQWTKFLRYLSSGYAIQEALKESAILRSQYNALIIVDDEKREQKEMAQDSWLRSAWPDELFMDICERVAMGELAKVVIPELAPSHLDSPEASFYRIKNLDPVFKQMWEDARFTAMERMADEMIEIVDDDSNDVIQGTDKHGNEVEISNPSAVRRAETRVKSRQWLMERLHSKQFGNKIQAEITAQVKDPTEVLAEARRRKKENADQIRKQLEKEVVGTVVND